MTGLVQPGPRNWLLGSISHAWHQAVSRAGNPRLSRAMGVVKTARSPRRTNSQTGRVLSLDRADDEPVRRRADRDQRGTQATNNRSSLFDTLGLEGPQPNEDAGLPNVNRWSLSGPKKARRSGTPKVLAEEQVAYEGSHTGRQSAGFLGTPILRLEKNCLHTPRLHAVMRMPWTPPPQRDPKARTWALSCPLLRYPRMARRRQGAEGRL